MKDNFLNKINKMKQDIIKEVNDKIHLFTEYKVGDILVNVGNDYEYEIIDIFSVVDFDNLDDIFVGYKLKNLNDNTYTQFAIHTGLVPKYDYDNKTERYKKAFEFYYGKGSL